MIGQTRPKRMSPPVTVPYILALNFSLFFHIVCCISSRSLSQRAKVKVQYFRSSLSIDSICIQQLQSIKLKYSMNPFERLRKTIENANINYQYPQDEEQIQQQTNANFRASSPLPQKTVTISNEDDVQRIRELCERQQLSSMKQVTEQAIRMQQLQKQLKRSENVIQNQMSELVQLQKQNQLLKANLNQQYSSVVQSDEKERKYKEEIHRINITVNELANEIQHERNSKKIVQKEVESLKECIARKQKEFQSYRQEAEKEKMKLASELEERVEMFEYHVKKGAEDRKLNKIAVAAAQQQYQKTLQACRVEISNLKHELMQARKTNQIESIYKKNLDDSLKKSNAECNNLQQIRKRLTSELVEMRENFQRSVKGNEELQRNLSSLGSELAEQKKNVKVKVVEVKDQTALLELDMYKRQCKELMQEKIIMKSLNNFPVDRTMEPEYRLAGSQQSNSV